MKLGITGINGDTTIRICGGRKTDEILPIFSSYRRGINVLLEGLSDDAVLLQNPSRGKIIISKTGRDTLLLFGEYSDDLSLNVLKGLNAIKLVRSALNDRIHESIATTRAIIQGEFGVVQACKILDNIDRYVEALRILNSR